MELKTVALGLVLPVVAALVWRVLDRDASVLRSDDGTSRALDRTLAEGVCLSQSLERGGGRISFDSCRTAKRRLGPFALGGCDELFLRNLKIVLPSVTDGSPLLPKTDPADPLSGLLSADEGFLKLQRLPTKFFGLHVDGLSVGRQVGTNVVCAFTANAGEMGRQGLRLRGCRLGGTNAVDGALVELKPRLRLRWSGGQMKL